MLEIVNALAAILSADFLSSAIRLATPIALAAVGACYAERSGVINIGLEGTMLGSAFASVIGTLYLQNALVGVVAGIAVGVLIAFLFGVLSIDLGANQIVVGAGVNIAVFGVAGYLSYILFRTPGVTPTIDGIGPIRVPVLSTLPWFGEVFFSHTPIVYVAVVVVVLAHTVLFRTPLGLRIRVSGENPTVDRAAGVDVRRVRYIAILVSGVLAALGGVNLALENLKFYQDTMVAGRGFIALAANIFGKWTPVGGAAVSLLFGASQALVFRMQALHIPPEMLYMLPYVLTVAVLVGAAGRAVAPAALGRPLE